MISGGGSKSKVVGRQKSESRKQIKVDLKRRSIGVQDQCCEVHVTPEHTGGVTFVVGWGGVGEGT